MKSTIVSMLIVLAVMITLPMFLMGDDGVLNKFFSSKKSDLAVARAKAPKNMRTVVTDEKVQVYKWVDEYGVTQFSNKPPESARDAQLLELSPDNVNIMDATKIPEKVSENTSESQGIIPTSPYSPKAMKKLMNQAGELQEKINQQEADRQKAMEKMFK